jgi:hypothetical protein
VVTETATDVAVLSDVNILKNVLVDVLTGSSVLFEVTIGIGSSTGVDKLAKVIVLVVTAI